MKSDAWISLFIDNAKYETVVQTLDMFLKAGFTNVGVFPPRMGTNLSSKVKHWIRIRVEGIVNHPFAMLLNTGLDVSMRLTGAEQRQFVSEVLASQEAYLDLYLRDLNADAGACPKT